MARSESGIGRPELIEQANRLVITCRTLRKNREWRETITPKAWSTQSRLFWGCSVSWPQELTPKNIRKAILPPPIPGIMPWTCLCLAVFLSPSLVEVLSMGRSNWVAHPLAQTLFTKSVLWERFVGFLSPQITAEHNSRLNRTHCLSNDATRLQWFSIRSSCSLTCWSPELSYSLGCTWKDCVSQCRIWAFRTKPFCTNSFAPQKQNFKVPASFRNISQEGFSLDRGQALHSVAHTMSQPIPAILEMSWGCCATSL